MTIPCNTKDLENSKFVELPDGSGNVAVRVAAFGANILSGIDWDAIEASYPDAVTEIFKYYKGGLSGALAATVTIVYTSSSKEDISTVVRT